MTHGRFFEPFLFSWNAPGDLASSANNSGGRHRRDCYHAKIANSQ